MLCQLNSISVTVLLDANRESKYLEQHFMTMQSFDNTRLCLIIILLLLYMGSLLRLRHALVNPRISIPVCLMDRAISDADWNLLREMPKMVVKAPVAGKGTELV
jgi:hypothetical protein